MNHPDAVRIRKANDGLAVLFAAHPRQSSWRPTVPGIRNREPHPSPTTADIAARASKDSPGNRGLWLISPIEFNRFIQRQLPKLLRDGGRESPYLIAAARWPGFDGLEQSFIRKHACFGQSVAIGAY